MPLVRLDSVSKTFRRRSGDLVRAVDGVSLSISAGETLGLIGESGSGKSTVGRLALKLLPPDGGTVEFEGRNLEALDQEELRRTRARMQIVFQEPYESLDPRMSVGLLIEEPLVIHERRLPRAERRARALQAMTQVALDDSLWGRYPGELSGGQQQRVNVARAIVTRPKFLVLDEPTSSLDLSVRAQILRLLAELQAHLGLAYLFISHDIHTVRYVAGRIAVMYLGQVVETGETAALFESPRHPYTRALLSSALSADPDVVRPRYLLAGDIPNPTTMPTGCRLHGRCPVGEPECTLALVPLRSVSPGHQVACLKADWEPG